MADPKSKNETAGHAPPQTGARPVVYFAAVRDVAGKPPKVKADGVGWLLSFAPSDGQSIVLSPGTPMLLHTGLKIILPKDIVMRLGAPLTPGKPGLQAPALEADYRAADHEIVAQARNESRLSIHINPGDFCFTARFEQVGRGLVEVDLQPLPVE